MVGGRSRPQTHDCPLGGEGHQLHFRTTPFAARDVGKLKLPCPISLPSRPDVVALPNRAAECNSRVDAPFEPEPGQAGAGPRAAHSRAS